MEDGPQKTPVEQLTEAMHATPVDMALARAAFAGFDAELATLDSAAKVAAITALEEPLNVGVERLEEAGETETRDELLGRVSLYGMIQDGLTEKAAPAPAKKQKTRTRQRRMSSRKA